MASPSRTDLRSFNPSGTGEVSYVQALFAPFFEAQRLSWNALIDWQQSMTEFNKDFWQQWACRFAGGVPIDG
jgi:hypothetical protein